MDIGTHQLLQTRNRALKEAIMRRKKGARRNIAVGYFDEHYPSLDTIRLVFVRFALLKP